jgi:hypothetical protein
LWQGPKTLEEIARSIKSPDAEKVDAEKVTSINFPKWLRHEERNGSRKKCGCHVCSLSAVAAVEHVIDAVVGDPSGASGHEQENIRREPPRP